MGFGYLFIGYLITFVLYLTVQSFGLGGVALFLGYAMMLLGLSELTRYQRAFSWAKWTCLPLMLTAAYQALASLSVELLWNVSVLKAPVLDAVGWAQFALMIFFQLAMLYGIREIGSEVGLLHISTKALRNSLFVSLYAILYLVTNLILVGNEEMRKYFIFSLMLSQAAYVLLNLFLLISCTKNICAEGEDEDAVHRHRWEFLNKVEDLFDRTRQKNIDRAKESGAAFAEKRRRKKEQRKNRK